jgi:hypothetical protein
MSFATRKQAHNEYIILKCKLEKRETFSNEEMELLEWYSPTFFNICSKKFVSGATYVKKGDLDIIKNAIEDMRKKLED